MLLSKSVLSNVYKKRRSWSRKGDYGHLLVVGGSKLYTGAPFLAALAALRTGCDLATVAAPERAANLAAKNMNLITHPLRGDFLRVSHVKDLMNLASGKDAIVIGNGLGRRKETFLAVNRFLGRISLPCVIDADAIHAIAGGRNVRDNFVVTPHAGEFYALTGKKVKNSVTDRISMAREVAKKMHATILLKGQVVVVSDGSNVAVNKNISPYATKGGTGDVLAGVCGSLLAQGAVPFAAACAASYIVGAATTIVAAKKKQSMLATDIIEKIPDVLS